MAAWGLACLAVAAAWCGVSAWTMHIHAGRLLRQDIAQVMQTMAAVPSAQRAAVIARLARNTPDGPYFYGYRTARAAAGPVPVGRVAFGWQTMHLSIGGSAARRVQVLALVWPMDGGYLLVARELREQRRLEQGLQMAFLGTGGLFVLLVLAFCRAIRRHYRLRLRCMAEDVERMAGGDLEAGLACAGHGDEFDQLARALDSMRVRIRQRMDDVRQVSSGIAHDLRTPLTHLRQRLDEAQRQCSDVDAYRGAVRRAISDVDQVLDTFSALLRMARIEHGQGREGFVPVDLSRLLSMLVDDYQPVFEDLGRRLDAHVAPGVYCLGDGPLLTQMLINVLDNAWRHTPAGTAVAVRLDRGADRARLVIEDRGGGIAAAHRAYVFERFARLDAARHTPGTGLGLSMVAAIAERHHIDIALTDAGPGLRVTLHIHLLAPPGRARSGAEPSR